MYLLDTNIIIFFWQGKHNLKQKIENVGIANCFISEITTAELKHGAEKSNRPDYQNQLVDEFIEVIGSSHILCISSSLGIFAKEKARLERLGTRIDDFDLLIGATAIKYDFTLVTNNTKHFERMENIKLEDWTIPNLLISP